MGGTSSWKMSGIDPSLTLALFFEVANQVRFAKDLELF